MRINSIALVASILLMFVTVNIVLAIGEYLFPLANCIQCEDNWYISQDTADHTYISDESSFDFNLISGGNSDSGWPVLSVLSGVVEFAGIHAASLDIDGQTIIDKGWGYYVVIRHDNGSMSRYAHLESEPIVKSGDKVKAGQFIGKIGDTGKSTTAHLHFGMYTYDGNGAKIAYYPPQLGQYTDITKYETHEDGTTSYKLYSSETAIYDPNMVLTAAEKNMYALEPVTSSPNTYVTITPYTDALFSPSTSMYFKAPQSVSVLPSEYESGVDFSKTYHTVKIDNDFLLQFIDTTQGESVESPPPIEYNPETAKSVAALNLADDIESAGLTDTDLIMGLAKMQLALQHAEEVGSNFEKGLVNLLSDSGLSLMKRFAGALGKDIAHEHILEGFRAIREHIVIPQHVLDEIAEGAVSSESADVLGSLLGGIIDVLKNMVTGSSGVAMLITLALVLSMIGFLQKDRARAEQNLKNILSSSVASATISKYWNLISGSTQNWLRDLDIKKDPDGNVRESLSMHLAELQKRRELMVANKNMSARDVENISKIDNSIILVKRIMQNTLPAQVLGGGDVFTDELIDRSAYNSFFDSLKTLLYFPGKVATEIQNVGQRVAGYVASAYRSSDAIVASADSTASKPVVRTTLASATELKINHWLSQYVVVGLSNGSFVAADGKTYTDLNKAWNVTREYLAQGKKPAYFSYSSSDTYMSLNYLPERNPYRGYKGTYVPYSSPVLVASAGISDVDAGGKTETQVLKKEGTLPQVDEVVRSATSALYSKVNHWLSQYVVVGLSNGKYAAPDGKMYGNIDEALRVAQMYADENKKAYVFSTPDVRALTSYTSLHYLPGKSYEDYIPHEESYEVANTNVPVGKCDVYSRFDTRLFAAQQSGIHIASYDDNRLSCTYSPSEDYPEGYNTKELRESAEKKVNDIIQNSAENDPYVMILPQWENKILSPRFPNGVQIGSLVSDTLESASTYLLFNKLLDQSKGITFVPDKDYSLARTVQVNNGRTLNNAGIRVVASEALPEDLRMLQEGTRGGEQGEEDKMVFRKALEGITVTGGFLYKLKSSNLIFGTKDLIGLLRDSIKTVQQEVAWEKELKQREAAARQIITDSQKMNALFWQIDALQQAAHDNKAVFVPDHGYYYSGYYFDTEDALSEYRFWQQHGGFLNPEMKVLLSEHAKVAGSFRSLDVLGMDSNVFDDVSLSKHVSIDFAHVDENEQKRKEIIDRMTDFLHSLQQVSVKSNVLPKEFQDVPYFEDYAKKVSLSWFGTWRGDGFSHFRGSYRDAVLMQMDIIRRRSQNGYVYA